MNRRAPRPDNRSQIIMSKIADFNDSELWIIRTTLEERYEITVEFMDERLTSRDAEARFVEGRASGALRRKDSSQLDAIAAQLICENWLRSR